MIEWVLIIIIHFSNQPNYTLQYNNTHFDGNPTCQEKGEEIAEGAAKLFNGSLRHHKYMQKVTFRCERS